MECVVKVCYSVNYSHLWLFCLVSCNLLIAIYISLSTKNGVEEISRKKQDLSKICHITDVCYRNFTLCSPMTFFQKMAKYVSF